LSTIWQTNSAGQLISLSYPSGRVMEYVYANGQVTEVRSGGQVVITNIQYQPFGPARSWTWGNGTGFSRVFDTDGRVASHSLGATSKTLGYDAASRIQAITDSANPGRNSTYGYDELDRLINSSAAAMRNYSYDAVGNRLTQSGLNNATYSYAANSNRLLGVAGSNAKTYSYDAAGNVTGDGLNSFAYDARGRQTITTTPTGNVLHGINALGQRVYKSVTASDTVFYYAPDGKLLAESDAQGTANKEYLYLGDQPIAVWAWIPGRASPPSIAWNDWKSEAAIPPPPIGSLA
jgi:YD repeat-containing protein